MKKTFVLSSLFCVLFIPLLATPATKVSLSVGNCTNFSLNLH